MFEILKQKINAIAPLDEAEFTWFKSLFVARKLRKRQYFLQEGNTCQHQAFVTSGLLRSYRIDEKGNEHILQFASEGWWMADLSSFLTNEPSFLNIDVLEDSEVLLISKSSWEDALQQVPALERYFRIILQSHLVATQKRLLQSLSETAEEKYSRFVITYPEALQRVPQHMVAAYLGISRETLSRVRKNMSLRKA